DDKGELRLANVDGRKLITVKDPQGKLLFSGPVETKEDLEKMPADVRERYNRLEQNDLPTVAPRSDTDNADDADTDEGDDQDDDDDADTGEVSQQVSFQSAPHQMVPQSISYALFCLKQKPLKTNMLRTAQAAACFFVRILIVFSCRRKLACL